MGDKSNLEGNKKRKKSYYRNSGSKKPRHNILDSGIKGFILTCNNKEALCIKEGYNLLNEYADKLYRKTDQELEKGDSYDVEKSLNAEIESMKTKPKRFHQQMTKCNNVLFIKADESIDPTSIVKSLLTDIEASGDQKCRFLMRLLPVEVTCKANLQNVQKSIEMLIEKHPEEKTSFMIQSKVRNNNDLSRTDMIEAIVEVVKQKRPNWVVNFEEPTLTINADVLQKTSCLSFLHRFMYFNKYNVIEFAKKITNERTKVTGEATVKEEAKVKKESNVKEEPKAEEEAKVEEELKIEQEAKVEEPRIKEEPRIVDEAKIKGEMITA